MLFFVKYRLNSGPVKRLKVDGINGVEEENPHLKIQLKEERQAEIDLEGYAEPSVEEFKDLLQRMADFNSEKSAD